MIHPHWDRSKALCFANKSRWTRQGGNQILVELIEERVGNCHVQLKMSVLRHGLSDIQLQLYPFKIVQSRYLFDFSHTFFVEHILPHQEYLLCPYNYYIYYINTSFIWEEFIDLLIYRFHTINKIRSLHKVSKIYRRITTAGACDVRDTFVCIWYVFLDGINALKTGQYF